MMAVLLALAVLLISGNGGTHGVLAMANDAHKNALAVMVAVRAICV